ncbi:hypothetical protein [Methanolobus halotolerans]|uniref:Uncharacterized protein n=1 Tax=Methanolobus halotolerans TaxID=2052935 RepID=A0A4E0Q5S4_9EURY|nr:hypothetical protein [Methanolobus halotolerans]TGC09211.1 hypothetical protein CUN85_07550 [Methanolobus halotolerans]
MKLFRIDRKILLSVMTVLVLFGAIIFTFTDFGVASSENTANSNIGAYSAGNRTDSVPESIYLFVERNRIHDEMLSRKVSAELESGGYDVLVSSDLQAEYPDQALFVSVTDGDLFYTPVHAQSEIDLMFVYSSTGSSEYFEKFRSTDDTVPVIFTSDGSHRYQLLMHGLIELRDTTQGLFSGRYYERHIADTIAEEVARDVQSHL